MEPLITLVVVTAAAAAVATARGQAEVSVIALRAGVCAMFGLTGVAHFVGMRAQLVDMVPASLPHPGLLVTITGVLEIAGAAGMVFHRLVGWAGLGLSLLLVAMFPANVSLALSGADLSWWDHLIPRSLTQVIFLAATISVTVLAFAGRTRRSGIMALTPSNREA